MYSLSLSLSLSHSPSPSPLFTLALSLSLPLLCPRLSCAIRFDHPHRLPTAYPLRTHCQPSTTPLPSHSLPTACALPTHLLSLFMSLKIRNITNITCEDEPHGQQRLQHPLPAPMRTHHHSLSPLTPASQPSTKRHAPVSSLFQNPLQTHYPSSRTHALPSLLRTSASLS